jgi:hypothetical protein
MVSPLEASKRPRSTLYFPAGWRVTRIVSEAGTTHALAEAMLLCETGVLPIGLGNGALEVEAASAKSASAGVAAQKTPLLNIGSLPARTLGREGTSNGRKTGFSGAGEEADMTKKKDNAR